MVNHMSQLTQALQELLAFLGRAGCPPATQRIMIVEVGTSPCHADGRIKVQRSDLRSPDEYSSRFDELLSLGMPWINLSCYGIDGDVLIVAVELPRPGYAHCTRTSLNLSGPTNAVVERAWDVSRVLAIE
jgi:hypothetical protein